MLELGHIVQPDVDEAEGIRALSICVITPSESLSDRAAHHQKEMPYLINYFVRSLGRDAHCADLMSYLLFTSKYTRDLIEIGYRDADERIDEIEDFLYSSDNGNKGSSGARGKTAASRESTSARGK